MTHAYNELYLGKAQVAMGDMLHFARYDMQWNIERYFDLYINTGVARRFYMGEPRVLVGMSGVELFYEVYYELTGAECDVKPSGRYDKSPEYFAGWSLAYYSWYRNMSYDDIQKIIPINEVVEMYELFHEMDVRQFVDALDKRGT